MIFYLKDREEKHTPHLLCHSSNVNNSHCWDKPKPGARNSVLASPKSGKDWITWAITATSQSLHWQEPGVRSQSQSQGLTASTPTWSASILGSVFNTLLNTFPLHPSSYDEDERTWVFITFIYNSVWMTEIFQNTFLSKWQRNICLVITWNVQTGREWQACLWWLTRCWVNSVIYRHDAPHPWTTLRTRLVEPHPPDENSEFQRGEVAVQHVTNSQQWWAESTAQDSQSHMPTPYKMSYLIRFKKKTALLVLYQCIFI